MHLAVPLTITTGLPTDVGHIPISARVDFGDLIARAGSGGERLDPGSIEVLDLADGAPVPCNLAEEFAHSDVGHVEFAVRDPAHTRYELRFAAVAPGQRRPHLAPRGHVPAVGVGDLLRHNAGEPRPLPLFGFDLVDLNGDGSADLAGTWNYYHRPGEPRSGVVCYPRVPREGSTLHFGDQVRLRYREPGAAELLHFPGTYVDAAFGDLDGDGDPELAFTEWQTGRIAFFRVAERDGGGWPIFEPAGELVVPEERTQTLTFVDLDGDGVLDLVHNGRWLRNRNPHGWPFEAEAPVDLGAGERVAFVDANGDGRLDLIGLEERPSAIAEHPDSEDAWPGCRAFWCRRLDSTEPAYDQRRPLPGLPPSTTRITGACDGDRPAGLLVQHNVWQSLSFYDLSVDATDGNDGSGGLAGVERARLESHSAVLGFSDQSWPCFCDWDGDGVTDLLIGGGYGWPRIVRNTGSNQQPSYAAPELLLSEGKPIRLQRDAILHSAHWHNLGYPYPSYVDWDGDGLPDLMLPNETNRMYWYRNIGTRQAPSFGPRQQLIVDGYPDDDDKRAEVGRLATDPELPNHPYPHDPTSPFFWRTGAAFADLNGDGLCDVITHDEERKLTLFAQYAADDGQRRLRKEGRLRLADGREIDDSIVGRDKHWTESFRAVDWDGDGRLDLIYNTAGTGHIYLLRNVGTPAAPVFAAPRQFLCYGEPIAFTIHGPNAWPVDYNDDGRPDLVGCVEWSVYPYLAHAALEMPAHPDWELGVPRTV